MSQIPTCFSHFLISYIHCSQFGKRSKWRKRRAAIAIATAKGQTTPSGWNKKSGVVYVLFFPFFWLKTFHCFEMETRGWHCHSYTVPPDSSLSSPWWKGGTVRVWWEKVLGDISIEEHLPFYHFWGWVLCSSNIVHSLSPYFLSWFAL